MHNTHYLTKIVVHIIDHISTFRWEGLMASDMETYRQYIILLNSRTIKMMIMATPSPHGKTHTTTEVLPRAGQRGPLRWLHWSCHTPVTTKSVCLSVSDCLFACFVSICTVSFLQSYPLYGANKKSYTCTVISTAWFHNVKYTYWKRNRHTFSFELFQLQAWNQSRVHLCWHSREHCQR